MNQVRGEEGIDATHMSAERPARQEQDLDHKSLKVPFDKSDCKVTPWKTAVFHTSYDHFSQ